MLEGALIMWFALTLLSLIYLIYSLIYHTPGPWVMKLAWFLVVLYTGPIGLFIYLISCKEPFPGTHELFINFRWKQSLGSEIHCLAGDATGIIIAAIILSFYTVLPAWEMLLEYVAGFFCGLLVFQALFMKDMMGGSYWAAVKGTFMAEWLSMNMIMAGMLPVMFVWRALDPAAADPATLSFWGSMSLAVIAGFILAYPVNDWLVINGLKHGMVTVRKPTDPVAQLVVTEGGLPKTSHHEHHEGHKTTEPGAAHEGGHKHHEMGTSKVSTAQMVGVSIITLIILAIGVGIGLIWRP